MSVGTNDIVDNAVTDAKISLDSVYILCRETYQHNLVFKRQAISFDPSIILRTGETPYLVEIGVAAAENNVYVVYPYNFNFIGYFRSTDGGASFNFGPNLTDGWSAGLPDSPAILATGNEVHVVWQHGNFQGNESIILYNRSTDGGLGFNITVDLSFGFKRSYFPAIAAMGNNVYVVWQERTGGGPFGPVYDILYRRSTDGGASFELAFMNLSNNPGVSSGPAIAAMGNNVYVVWADRSSGFYYILYRRSTDGGASFGNTMNLSNRGALSPAIAAMGNNVYVVWANTIGPGNSVILYRRSTDGGASFGGTMNLSNNPGVSSGPAIAAMGNNVYVVWANTIDYPVRGNSVILYRRSTDGGASFGGTVNLTGIYYYSFVSFHPAIAISNNLT